MPNEKIVTKTGTYKEGDPWIQVGWSRNQYVQIATLEQNAGGQWIDLERDSLNRLIRTLRRARDQAFGADA